MSPPSKIVTLTPINAELFTNDEGEFPTFITLVISNNPSDTVLRILGHMRDFFIEHFQEHGETLCVTLEYAEVVQDSREDTPTLLTPNTLILHLECSNSRRLVVLELGTELSDFTIH